MTFEFKPEVNHPEAVHISLDLETASTATNAAILQIGAVCINNPSIYYSRYISPADNDKHGRHVDVATMEWWSKQDPQVRARVFNNPDPVTLEEALEYFVLWCKDLCAGDFSRIYLWSKGADFDLPILKSAYEIFGDYPFNFRNHRCYRTEMSAVDSVTQRRRAEIFLADAVNFQAHDALWDARLQARLLSWQV